MTTAAADTQPTVTPNATPAPREFLGVRAHPVTLRAAVEQCAAAIDTAKPISVGVINAAKIVKMVTDDALRQSVLGSDLIIADGQAVVWASRALGKGLPERVAGIDLFEALLAEGNTRKWSVFLFGARQDVLDEVVRRINEKHPDLHVAGARNGYFDASEQGDIADQIKASGAQLLFVGITSPKKEIFLDNFGNCTGTLVRHGVGGSFDVMAGKVTRAPRWMQKMGLEWLHRVFQEPGRMWKRYAVTNTIFIWMMCRERLQPGLYAKRAQKRSMQGQWA